jgi:hypothetical protein
VICLHNDLMTGAKAAAAALAAVVVLSGCANLLGPHNVITATDRHRLAVMEADPIFRTQVPGTSYTLVGETWGPYSWRRGQVTAEIYLEHSRTDTMSPLPVQAFMRDLIAGMQARGWAVYYSDCNFDSLSAGTPPGVLDGPTWWYDTVYAYRVYQGVSYWASLTVNANATDGPVFESDVEVTLLVPAASEQANLFPDHPAGMPISSVCAAATSQLTAAVTQGSPITVAPQSDHLEAARPDPGDTSR